MDHTEIVDRILITDLLHAYADCVDRSDIAGLAALFAQNAVMDMGNGDVFTGRDRLHALFLDRIGLWTTTNHHVSTITIRSYDGAAARTTAYLYAFHDSPERDTSMHLWGRYEDDLVKHGEQWLIGTRRLRVAGVRETGSAEVPERFERFPRQTLPQS